MRHILTILLFSFLVGCAGKMYCPPGQVAHSPYYQCPASDKDNTADDKGTSLEEDLLGEEVGKKKKEEPEENPKEKEESEEEPEEKEEPEEEPEEREEPEEKKEYAEDKPYIDDDEIIISNASAPRPRKISFRTGKADITGDESTEILDQVADILREWPDLLLIEIQGHTDSRGSRSKNIRLSRARAAAVREYLIDQGIDSSRLAAKGYGPKKPIASNKTREGRAQNRRVEFKIKKRKE